MLRSQALQFKDFETSWYKRWASELKQDVRDTGDFMRLSNKFWQNAAILQALHERGAIQSGKKGIGFGVGKERLPAVLAKYNVHVVATDQDFRDSHAKHWKEKELAQEIDDLNALGICPQARFKKQVSLSPLDMRKIPNRLHGKYDFAWSNCALGHLGSIEAGIDFILNSAHCLKPGGFAVHTTEINVLSDSSTVLSGDTVVFRPRDIYKLSQRLHMAGYRISALRFNLGDTMADHRVTMRPEFGNDYSKLQISGHVATQIILIVHRPKHKTSRIFDKGAHKLAHRIAQRSQKQFAARNPFMIGVKKSVDHPLSPGDITALQKSRTVTLGDKPKTIRLLFRNDSDVPLFNAHDALIGTHPILLATNDPEDRASKFRADDWHGSLGNRPSIHLEARDANATWQEASYISPKQEFAFRLTLSPNKVKRGVYSEVFSVVQEGVAHLPDTKVNVTIKRV